ncbi:hypothetical protein SESBI_42298 [Sesbania bispinosa]|nr:hypothetical protein SESBI_42298 [Sesbania bispinosa]
MGNKGRGGITQNNAQMVAHLEASRRFTITSWLNVDLEEDGNSSCWFGCGESGTTNWMRDLVVAAQC